MDAQAIDLIKRAARATVTYAAMFGVAYIVINLLSKIPILGLLFYCVNFLMVLAAYFASGYFITPRLSGFPAGQTKAMLALYIGIGIAAVLTVALTIATLVTGILGLLVGTAFGGSDSAFRSATVGGVGLILGVIGAIIGGLLIGTLLSFLGSYLALDRNKSLEPVARPF